MNPRCPFVPIPRIASSFPPRAERPVVGGAGRRDVDVGRERTDVCLGDPQRAMKLRRVQPKASADRRGRPEVFVQLEDAPARRVKPARSVSPG